MEDLPPHQQVTPQSPVLTNLPPRPSPIFFGPHGLRAGWSIVLYLAVLLAQLFLVGVEMRWVAVHLHRKIAYGGEMHPLLPLWQEAGALIAVLLATAAMARVEARPAAFYGLSGVDRLRQFAIGLVCGFGFLSLLIAILVGTHRLALGRVAMSASQALGYAAVWGLFFFLVGLTEELMLRGYLLYTLARGIRFWPAAVLLASLFGLLHRGNPGESPFGLVAAALIALVFSLSLWRLGHLWWAIGFHAAWDWAESFFYGTPDSGMVSAGRLMHATPAGSIWWSGGATGPEGSVWVALIVLLAALFVWFTQPARGVRLAVSPPRLEHPGQEMSS